MRHNANPAACYIDGRIQEILNNIEEIASDLVHYSPSVWEQLFENTHAVFKALHEKHQAALAAA